MAFAFEDDCVEIRAARPHDGPEICSLLQRHMNPSWPIERWRRILDYSWRPMDADLGCVLVDAGRIAGFLGMVRAERPIGGTLRRFANLTSWYLLRPLRGTGLGTRMLVEATSDESTTFTNLTPARATIDMVRRAGFETLDEERVLFRGSATTKRSTKLEVARNWGSKPGELDWRLRRILHDHAGFDLQFVTLCGGPAPCHLVLQAKRKAEGRLYLDVLFASDTEALSRHAQDVADAILSEPGSVLAVDRRWMTDLPRNAVLEKLPLPRLYKPAGVTAAEVDMLYSEIPLLDLKLP